MRFNSSVLLGSTFLIIILLVWPRSLASIFFLLKISHQLSFDESLLSFDPSRNPHDVITVVNVFLVAPNLFSLHIFINMYDFQLISIVWISNHQWNLRNYILFGHLLEETPSTRNHTVDTIEFRRNDPVNTSYNKSIFITKTWIQIPSQTKPTDLLLARTKPFIQIPWACMWENSRKASMYKPALTKAEIMIFQEAESLWGNLSNMYQELWILPNLAYMFTNMF